MFGRKTEPAPERTYNPAEVDFLIAALKPRKRRNRARRWIRRRQKTRQFRKLFGGDK
jgi:hypothetical protein